MADKLNPMALGIAAAAVSAAIMLVLGIFRRIGIYSGAAGMMEEWHMFFSLSIGGIIAGMIEAAVDSFIIAYAFAWVYNRYA